MSSGSASKNTGSLRRYILTRLLLVVPMVFILLTIVFLLMRVAPGNPIAASVGAHLTPAALKVREAQAGFNKPLIVQYGDYLKQVFSGNFGTTITDNRPVTQIIEQNGGATLELTIAAMFVAVMVGIPLGLLAGRMRDTWVDVSSRMFGIVIYAAPVFFLGLLAQELFGHVLGWLPTTSQAGVVTQLDIKSHTNLLILDAMIDGKWSALPDLLKHLVLPACVLGLTISGVVIRLVRVNVIQTLRGDYIEAARARGIGERGVVVRHALRNALVPIVTITGLQAALLMSGAVLTEQTFNWPGIGNRLVFYLESRDYTAVQGIVTAFTLSVVVISLLIDVVNAWIDPRVRF
ncbi:MAG TPA: ABC transporter permease [Mycobacteriales bacterium]|nr:ABC transporter permease [Mycobacteriales bacterium]